MRRRHPRTSATWRAIAPAVLLVVVPPSASATWSVVAADRSTGEVALAQATCIVGPDLQRSLASVRPGIGGGCVQQWWDNGAEKRVQIWKKLANGFTPQQVIDIIQENIYQFGVVDLNGQSATFTGSSGGAYKGGVANQVGDLAYAIQGNVLAGQAVVVAAEQALLGTSGDLAERVMAAMMAAAQAGGDGRCSCSQSAPTSCGAPPPGFDVSTAKSAHTAFFLLARIGDDEGVCNAQAGCANGDYYLNLNVAPGQSGLPDPIVELSQLFTQWRASLVGRPDHLESTAVLTPPAVPGNGTASSTLSIVLEDYLGTPIPVGGATVTVTHAEQSAKLASIGPVTDHGDGTYSVQMTAGAAQGVDRFWIEVDDGLGVVTLYPLPELVHGDTLSGAPQTISASNGGTIAFSLDGPERSPPAPYLLLGSASGTAPGVPLVGTSLPLNYDWFMLSTFALKNTTYFPGSSATLSSSGHGAAAFVAPPGTLSTLVGLDLHFAFLTPDTLDFASNPVLVSIVP